FTHPLADAPRAGAPLPSLLLPTLGTSQSQVKAGGQLGVNGSSFIVSPSTSLRIEWDDLSSPQLSESQIEWGPKGEAPQRTPKQRIFGDKQNFFDATNLRPERDYQFRVRDCEPIGIGPLRDLTCSPWSDPVSLKTGPQGGEQVTLYLDTVTLSTAVGSAPLAPNGTFQSAVTIPSTATPGTHTRYAVVSATAQQGLPRNGVAPRALN